MTDVYLGLRVVLGLLLAADLGPPLIRIEQIVPVVADDAGGAGVHQRLDARLLAGLDDGPGAVDIDPLEDVLGVLGVDGERRGRVDDHVGLDVLEDRRQLLAVGDVALVVGRVWIAVLDTAQVERGDGRRGPRLDGLVDNVVAEEAVAANDEDIAEGASCLLLFCHGGGCVRFADGTEAGWRWLWWLERMRIYNIKVILGYG